MSFPLAVDADAAVLARLRHALLQVGWEAGVTPHLFDNCQALEAGPAVAELGSQTIEDLLAVGLLQQQGDILHPTMRISVIDGILIVSDIWDAAAARADDIVMAPDTANTRSFLAYLPKTPCQRFLEACGGAGAAALVAARNYAGQAASFDITQRSTSCAAFSARLNGIENFEARCGSAFAPAAGAQYDRIVCHVPYAPVAKATSVYRDCGSDGEQIMRLHIEQVSSVLAPGGRFYCRAIGSDRTGQPLEERVRQWLGSRQMEFDVALVMLRPTHPIDFAVQNVIRGSMSIDELPAWEAEVTRLRMQSLSPIWLVVQRHGRPRQPFTVRRTRTRYSGPKELDWLLDWETLRAEGGAEQAILENALTAADAALLVRNEVHGGRWQSISNRLRVEFPYEFEVDIDAMGTYILPRCNGTITGHALLHALIAERSIRPDADAHRFAAVLAELVSGGVLYVQGHQPADPRLHVDCVCCAL